MDPLFGNQICRSKFFELVEDYCRSKKWNENVKKQNWFAVAEGPIYYKFLSLSGDKCCNG